MFLSAAIGQFRLWTVLVLAITGAALALHAQLGLGAGRPRLEPGAWTLLGVFGLLFLWLALYPPHGFDEQAYHLPIARSLVESGGLRWLDHLRFPAFPQLAELLAAALSLVAAQAQPLLADRAIHLPQALAAIAIAGLLIEEARDCGRPAGDLLSAALFLGSPLVVYQAFTLYVDLVLSLAVLLAVVAASRFRAQGAEPEAGAWLRLAGLAVGSAFAVKYTGAFAGFLVLLWVVPGGLRRGALLRDLAVVTALAGLAALPTAVWLVAVTGNPVFPFLFSRGTAWGAAFPAWPGERWRTLLLLPWSMYFDRPAVGFQPPPSPFLPLAAGCAVIASRVDAESRRCLVAAALFCLLTLTLYPDVRYALPSLPILLLAAGRSPWPRPSARGLRLAVALAAAIGVAYAVFAGARLGSLALGERETEDFLARRNPGFRALRAAEVDAGRQPPPRLYAFANETLTGLSRGRLYGEINGRLSQAEARVLLDRPEELERRLRELAVSHLILLRKSLPPSFDPAAPGWVRHFRAVYEDSEALVFRRL